MKKAPSWGFVLSGGAAWGLANLGVLEVFEEHGLRPDCLGGSSMGAIVGALYALGHRPAELRSIVEDLKPGTIATISERALKDGLHGGLLTQALEKHLKPLVGDAAIGDCRIPLVCVAGRVKEPIPWHRILVEKNFTARVAELVEPHVFPPETRLLDALMATSAIPVVFSPVRIGGDEFIDLVAFGALPARTLRERYAPDILVGTDCNPQYGQLKDWLPGGWKNFIESGLIEYRKSQAACDLLLKPTFKAGPFRFDKATDFVDAGRAATMKDLPKLRKLLQK